MLISTFSEDEIDAVPLNNSETNTEPVCIETSISNSDSLPSLSETPETKAVPIINENDKNDDDSIPKPTKEGNNKRRAIPKSNEDSGNKTDAVPQRCNYLSKNTPATFIPEGTRSYNMQAALLPKKDPRKEFNPRCHKDDPFHNQPDSSYNDHHSDGEKILSMFSQCSNITIGTSNLSIGNSNITNVFSSEPRKIKSEHHREKFIKYFKSNTVLTEKHLNKIAKYLGNKWKSVGRDLEIKDAMLENIEANYSNNVEEQSFQMLNKWLQLSKSETCTTSKLAEALFEAECYDSIQYLPLEEE
ncbi:receptor-interacting serine/threonine-protein kinase 1 isoform X2 [Octopus bimaculoides]|uniref:receptor-interacting serine/threonine-protein kinase 1 isoform X2 n=1 Tax=Octopus bimaculoides TaxID=37653 RepID=UPI0022E4DCC7|nr:receptor-interacting serine/threonine-protein kinase 1 isoform X2 [Octopus bimaculoides]